MPASLYQIDAPITLLGGETKHIRDFAGQVLLVVNTASKCVLTPQYKDLEQLYQQYHDRGFTVLGFPTAEFMKQEFESEAKIGQFCQRNYGVSFPMTQKANVRKSRNQHPVFQFLTRKDQNQVANSNPLWNFTKYLVDREGRLVESYLPFSSPTAAKVTRRIESLL